MGMLSGLFSLEGGAQLGAGHSRKAGTQCQAIGRCAARQRARAPGPPGETCTQVSAHYAHDAYALADRTGGGVLKDGGDAWLFFAADPAFGRSQEKDTTGVIRDDGHMVKDMCLFEAKKPSGSKSPWDYSKPRRATIPGDQALLQIARGVCPLAKK
jgi:hypothetical protein